MDSQEIQNAGTSPPAAAHCVRLFGVKLTDLHHASSIHNMGFMRKSVSTGNLALMGFNTFQGQQSDCAQARTENGSANPHADASAVQGSSQHGYASDGLMQSSSMSLRERKKGVPWTEEEHRLFLAGLQKLGKGDWRGISRNFVTSRTPTQVASHAQKYFLRQGNLNKRKRRSSLFDIINANLVIGTDVIGDDSQTFGATELVRPPLELGLQPVTASSSSLMDSSSSYSKPLSSTTRRISADLCLGLSHSHQQQVSTEDFSAALSRSGKQPSMMDPLPLSQFSSSAKSLGLDDGAAGTGGCRSKSICTISSSSCSSKSISSAPSLCRIDEMSELSSLSLSLGPPASVEAPELALKLEQPATSRLSVSPSAMSEVLYTAGKGNTSKVASMANVIKVV